MAGISFWRHFTRLWPFGRPGAGSQPRRPHSPLWLEQLGDRTLPSSFGRLDEFRLLVGPREFEPASAADRLQIVLSTAEAAATFPVRVDDFSGHDAGQHLYPDLVTDATGPGPDGSADDGFGHAYDAPPATDVGAADGFGHSYGPPQPATDVGPHLRLANAEMSLPDSTGAMLQQLYVTQEDDSRGDLREYAMMDRALSDRTVLGYLLEPTVEDRASRHVTDGEGLPGGPDQDGGRPDTAASDFALSDRTDGPGIARSLAAVFREELPANEVFGENPVGKIPDVLVSYEPDLLDPRAELLPLNDGSRALVAALLAGVPFRDAAPPATADGSASLTGSPVGLDSGPPSADGMADPAEFPEGSDVAMPPQAAAEHQPGAAAGDPDWTQTDPETGAVRVHRLTVPLLDALLAGGAFSLYCHLADHYGTRKQWRGLK